MVSSKELYVTLVSLVSTLDQLKLSPTSEFFSKTFHCWLAAQGLAWEFNIFTTYKSTPAQNILYEELYRPVGCRIFIWEEHLFCRYLNISLGCVQLIWEANSKKQLKYFELRFCIKSQFRYFNSTEQRQVCSVQKQWI